MNMDIKLAEKIPQSQHTKKRNDENLKHTSQPATKTTENYSKK